MSVSTTSGLRSHRRWFSGRVSRASEAARRFGDHMVGVSLWIMPSSTAV